MAGINQPSLRPTNKLTTAMAAASAAGIVKATAIHAFPQYADPIIWEPLPYIVGFVFGYFKKDAPNVATGTRQMARNPDYD